MKKLLALCCILGLVTCSQGEHKNADHKNHNKAEKHHQAAHTNQAVTISKVRLRPPLPGKNIAAAFFELNNNGEANKLISVSTPLTGTVEIHTHLNEDGVMKMRRIEAVDLPKGQTSFKRGGHHLMLFDVSIDSDIKTIPLTLNFATGDPVTVTAKIVKGDKEKGNKKGNKKDRHKGH